MKSEFYNHPIKGLCIIISDFSIEDLNLIMPHTNSCPPFSDIDKIAINIKAGKKIAAIKEIRTQTGWQLKEAKEFIDRYISSQYGSLAHEYYDTEYYEKAARKFISDFTQKNFIEKEEFKI